MGAYLIIRDPDKLNNLVERHGAIKISQPRTFGVISEQALICVVDNVLFQAAALIYDKKEFEAFAALSDERGKTWLLMSRERAYALVERTPKTKSL